jgi:hypothetical protein
MGVTAHTGVSDAASAVPQLSALTRDFLLWVAGGPRSYAEAMEAWRTSCPRLTIWEDALLDGLICLEHRPGMTMSDTRVVITARGRSALEAASSD